MTPKASRRDTELSVSDPVYGGIVRGDEGFFVAFSDQEQVLSSEFISDLSEGYHKRAKKLFAEYQAQQDKKIVAVGLAGDEMSTNKVFGADLWLKLDIVPHFFPASQHQGLQYAEKIAREVAKKYQDSWVARVAFGRKRKVIPSALAVLEDFQSISQPNDFSDLSRLAVRAKEARLKVVFFSSTPSGGGVALMRHALMRIYRLLGVDVSWHVMRFRAEAFKTTKLKFHNVLQAIAPASTVLTEANKRVFRAWSAWNAQFFLSVYQKADVVVIDDPQPSGLIPYIKKVNPRAKIIYRSHIQIRADLLDKKDSPQWRTWQFLRKNILQADVFVSHPLQMFVPQEVPREKVVFMPATTDPLDGLNKELSESQMRHYGRIFNRLLLENKQSPLDFNRPYIIQIARFDPSKGIPDVIEAYRLLRKKLGDLRLPLKKVPQLVIVGNGAVDDPEGSLVLQEILFLLEMERYNHLLNDIKVARVPHIDQLLNTLLRKSVIALQLSHREGFEVKVTEALEKGIPVIAYKIGGIPLQIKHGFNGFLVSTGDTKKVTEYLYRLMTDAELYARLRKNAKNGTSRDYWTVRNAVKWLSLALEPHTRRKSKTGREADAQHR